MKRLALFLVLFGLMANLFSQTDTAMVQKDTAKVTTEVKPVKDSVTFKVCHPKDLYAVDFFLLEEMLGKKLDQPKEKPEYKGEWWKLVKYFNNNSFDKRRTKDMVFRVSVGFIVNCEGKAGDFKLLSEHEDMELTLAQEIVRLTRLLPEDWIPAQRKGKPVDCWYAITFTVHNGDFSTIFGDY